MNLWTALQSIFQTLVICTVLSYNILLFPFQIPEHVITYGINFSLTIWTTSFSKLSLLAACNTVFWSEGLALRYQLFKSSCSIIFRLTLKNFA